MKKLNGYVFMNKGEFDLENMTFVNTLEDAKGWKGQDILKVEVRFEELKKGEEDEII